MISFEFTHRDENGKVETFSSDSRDMFVWEATDRQNRAFMAPFAEGTLPRMVDMYKLAWISAKRLGLVEQSLELAAYAAAYNVEVDMEEAVDKTVDPTLPGASDGG